MEERYQEWKAYLRECWEDIKGHPWFWLIKLEVALSLIEVAQLIDDILQATLSRISFSFSPLRVFLFGVLIDFGILLFMLRANRENRKNRARIRAWQKRQKDKNE